MIESKQRKILRRDAKNTWKNYTKKDLNEPVKYAIEYIKPKQSPRTEIFTGKSYQNLKDKFTTILLKFI